MRPLFVLLLSTMIAGCASCPPCPREASTVYSSEAGVMLRIDPGHFDSPDNYFTDKEIEEMMRRALEEAARSEGY